MYKHIFKYEFKKLTADKTLWIVSLVLVLFTLLSLYNGVEWSKFQLDTVDEIKQDQYKKSEMLKERIINHNAKRKPNSITESFAPDGVSSFAYLKMHYVAKPPSPNAIFAVGQSDIYPYYIRFSSFSGKNMLINKEVINPVNLLIGKFDFSFMIIYLLPLLIIAISYDIFSSEKERGTLTLIKIYQPNSLKYLFIKLLFRYVWILTLLLICIVIGIVLFSPFSLFNFNIYAYFVVFGLTAFYSLFWFSLCFLVNMFMKTSLFNGIALAMIWLVIVFFIPTVLNTIITSNFNIPSRNKQVAKLRSITDEYNYVNNEEMYKEYYKKNPQYKKPVSDTINNVYIPKFYYKYIISITNINSHKNESEKEFTGQLSKQQKALEYFRYLSPSLLTNLNFNKLSKNSFHDFEDFNGYFKEQKNIWCSFVYDRVFSGQKFYPKDIDDYKNFSEYKSKNETFRPYFLDILWMFILSLVILFFSIKIYKLKN